MGLCMCEWLTQTENRDVFCLRYRRTRRVRRRQHRGCVRARAVANRDPMSRKSCQNWCVAILLCTLALRVLTCQFHHCWPLLIQEQAEKEDKNGFEMYKQGEVEAAVRCGPIAFIKCLSVAASLTGAYCARDEMCALVICRVMT